jgi:DNA-binding response OmpR family regulator
VEDKKMASNYRALVVDDEEIVLASVERTLTREGYVVDMVLTAEEALDKLSDGIYDVVITDLMMPNLNGIELLARMKEMNLSIPAVMVTGYPTIKTAIEALKLGAVDYIPKPFTRQELLSPVSRAVRRKENEKNGYARTSVYFDTAAGPDPTASDEIPPVYVLRKHSWARRCENDTLVIGIEPSFLLTVGVEQIATIRLPLENEVITQGHSSIVVVLRSGVEHRVYMPLSGRIIETDSLAVESIIRGDIERWLIRIEPSNLEEEVASLKVRRTTL